MHGCIRARLKCDPTVISCDAVQGNWKQKTDKSNRNHIIKIYNKYLYIIIRVLSYDSYNFQIMTFIISTFFIPYNLECCILKTEGEDFI